MIRTILVTACLLLAPVLAFAQTPSTTYTFTSDDVYRALNPIEQKELDKIQEDLRELQETGRALPEGSASRRAVLAEFERVKAEREEKFGFIRGINGTTITFWGEPLPSSDDILDRVFLGRKSGYGDGMLYPHYYYDENAMIRGSNEPPPEAASPGGSGLDLGASGLVVPEDSLESSDCNESTYLFGTSVYECDDD